jgi:hypothetical protein
MADTSINSYTRTTDYSNLPAVTDQATVARAQALSDTARAENVQTGSLSATAGAGELPFEPASVSGIDWSALTDDLAASANLSVSLNQIMVLLIQVMAQMRQDQREVALGDAQNALQSGLNAAKAMKDAAVSQLVSGIVTNAASMASAAVTLKQTSSQMKSLKDSKQAFDAADADGKVKAREDLDFANSSSTLQGNKTRAVAELTQSAAGLMAGLGNFIAESARAEGKAYEAQSQYESNMQQMDQAFFQQLGDFIRAMLQNLQSVESATHQANQAIYNV